MGNQELFANDVGKAIDLSPFTMNSNSDKNSEFDFKKTESKVVPTPANFILSNRNISRKISVTRIKNLIQNDLGDKNKIRDATSHVQTIKVIYKSEARERKTISALFEAADEFIKQDARQALTP